MILAIYIAISLLSAAGVALSGHLIGAAITFVGTFVGLVLVTAGVFVVACAVVDREKPQEKDSPFYRILAKVAIELAVVLCRVKVNVSGMENIPQEGRFLLTCNHLSNLDPVLLLRYFYHKQVSFISKKENDDMPFIGPLMHKLRCQLINRENDREALKTIIKCIQMVREDEASIGLFPEGYCSLDGRLRQFRSGAFKIAQKTGVPIVVCTVKNTRQALSRLVKLKSSEVTVHLVEVIPGEKLQGMSTQEIAHMVYEIMIRDLGEECRCEEKGVRPELQQPTEQ